MYVLYPEDHTALTERSRLFEQYMEPLLKKLEALYQSGKVPASLPEITAYLQVCRWPFRKLEYSFAMDVLLNHLKPGSRYLDAGSGVTPFAHVFAERGVQAEACDGDGQMIERLRRLDPSRIYDSPVTYMGQDLTATTYPTATFDAVTCISVLEHIPAPYDQKAVKELVRILKPGGILVLTVDFTPPPANGQQSRLGYYFGRATNLIREGNLSEIGRGLARKLQAQQAVSEGAASQPRSANQCFEVGHLEQDILPLMEGEELPSSLPFATDLHQYTPEQAQRFWNLEEGLFNNQGRRLVLPAACIFRKPVA